MSQSHLTGARKGRGAASNRTGRFAVQRYEPVDDGWNNWSEEVDSPLRPQTRLRADPARSLISRNRSPDVPFELSINPYRGCEHGCIYCFARPSHSFLDLSPGLDFETQLFYKANAAELLERELSRPGYRPSPIALGINTDAYQPVERQQRVTRELLEVLWRFRHPVSLLTKSSLILRDLDLLTPMAELGLVTAAVSLTTLDDALKRRLEPRTAGPDSRLRSLKGLAEAGIPTRVMAAPVIPALNDHELEAILDAAQAAGATAAGYVLLRLPHEVAPLFVEWLETHYPDRAAHVMSLVRQARGGRDYDSRWGKRMTGTGEYAELLQQRFQKRCRRLGLQTSGRSFRDGSNIGLFRRPPRPGDQADLFD